MEKQVKLDKGQEIDFKKVYFCVNVFLYAVQISTATLFL